MSEISHPGCGRKSIRNTHSSPQPFGDRAKGTIKTCDLCPNIEIKALCFGGMSSGLKQEVPQYP